MRGFLIRVVDCRGRPLGRLQLVPGVEIADGWSLLLAALLLGIVNAFVRPVLVILTLPLTILTLGLFLLVINAGMLSLVAWMLDGMTVAGFWPALFGAIVVVDHRLDRLLVHRRPWPCRADRRREDLKHYSSTTENERCGDRQRALRAELRAARAETHRGSVGRHAAQTGPVLQTYIATSYIASNAHSRLAIVGRTEDFEAAAAECEQ